jgi:hypothetical protein
MTASSPGGKMNGIHRQIRGGAVVLATVLAGACSQAGQLGEILGGVLGGGGGNFVNGSVRSVDTRAQQISVQQSNGESVAFAYDNQTKVVYQDRVYAVSSLESGDQVSARVQQLQGGGYYTDSVFVTQPVSGSTSTNPSAGVQSLQGTVRQIDRNQGVFTVDAGNGVTLTVAMPYNAATTDVNKFNALRSGDFVRFYGVYVSNTRVDLKQFN